MKNSTGIVRFLYVMLQRAVPLTGMGCKLLWCILACEGCNLSNKPHSLACRLAACINQVKPK